MAATFDPVTAMRYCPDCRRAVLVARDHATNDTLCALCARVLNQRYVDNSTQWLRAFPDGRAADHSASNGPSGATFAAFASPAARSLPASDGAHAEDGNCSVALPRMRGAVGAAGASRGCAPKATRGAAGPAPAGSLADALNTIDEMAGRLGLPAAVTGRAREVFRKLEEARAFPKGGKCRNRQALYAACLHMACRAEGNPRTFKELASVTGDAASAGVKDIGRLVKHIKVHLGEEEGAGGQGGGEMTMMMGAVVRAGDYLRRFGTLLGMGDVEVDAALDAARRLEKDLDVRRNPDSIAAAVVYMTTQRVGSGKSIRDVSTATGVSEVTIKEVYYKDLSQHADLLFG